MIIFDQDFLNLVYELVNIDKYLTYFATNYSTYCYFILFLIIFCETGLVVMPFLPGDSLLFVAGTISANGQLNIIYVTIAIFFGALCGDSCNFNIGKYFGRRLFNSSNSKIFKQKYLIYAEDFYAKHGYKMIIVARFVPILRTFSPFVAGMSAMSYIKFILCSLNTNIL